MPKVTIDGVMFDVPPGTTITIPGDKPEQKKPRRRVAASDLGRNWKRGDDVDICYCGSPMCSVCG